MAEPGRDRDRRFEAGDQYRHVATKLCTVSKLAVTVVTPAKSEPATGHRARVRAAGGDGDDVRRRQTFVLSGWQANERWSSADGAAHAAITDLT